MTNIFLLLRLTPIAVLLALMGLMLVATARDFRQALTSSTEKRDAAQA